MIGPKVAKPTRAESINAYELVNLRAKGVCEGCGVLPALEVHHRKFRGRGGRDEVVNLIALCGLGNMSGCHGIAHSGTRGTELGWAVSASADPGEVLVIYRGRLSKLHPDGRVENKERPS